MAERCKATRNVLGGGGQCRRPADLDGYCWQHGRRNLGKLRLQANGKVLEGRCGRNGWVWLSPFTEIQDGMAASRAVEIFLSRVGR